MSQHVVPVAGGAAEAGGDAGAMVLAQGENAPCGFGGFATDTGHAAQGGGQPAFPVAFVAHRLQALVVFSSVLLEEMRQVQRLFEQDFALATAEEATSTQSWGTLDDLLARFRAVEYWDCTLSPHCE